MVSYVKGVVSGVCSLPLTFGKAVSYTAKAVSGTGFTLLSIVTAGKKDKYNEKAHRTVKASYILPFMYRGVITILNREAVHSVYNYFDKADYKDGFFRIKLNLFDYASNYDSQVPMRSSLLGRIVTNLQIYVGTRLLYALAAVVAVVSRVADLILGAPTALLSVVYLGQARKLNRFAMANLSVFGAIDDLSKGMRGFVNPWQSNMG